MVQAEVDGERLTDDDISSIFALLIIAGNDTTRQSIAHGMKALTDFPEQRAWLMEDLDGRLPIAVEEIIRWATPIMTFRRTAAHDTELGGHHITEGDKVIMFYSSANMDTAVFDHPEQLNLSRSPNKHVAFGGGGIHHCLGAQLARRQINATFRELLTRLPDIHTVGEPELGNGNFFHTVMSMTARVHPRDVEGHGPMKIVVDRNLCSSIGLCEATAPDIFEIGADGALHILLDDIPRGPPDRSRAGLRELPHPGAQHRGLNRRSARPLGRQLIHRREQRPGRRNPRRHPLLGIGVGPAACRTLQRGPALADRQRETGSAGAALLGLLDDDAVEFADGVPQLFPDPGRRRRGPVGEHRPVAVDDDAGGISVDGDHKAAVVRRRHRGVPEGVGHRRIGGKAGGGRGLAHWSLALLGAGRARRHRQDQRGHQDADR